MLSTGVPDVIFALLSICALNARYKYECTRRNTYHCLVHVHWIRDISMSVPDVIFSLLSTGVPVVISSLSSIHVLYVNYNHLFVCTLGYTHLAKHNLLYHCHIDYVSYIKIIY